MFELKLEEVEKRIIKDRENKALVLSKKTTISFNCNLFK